MIMKKTYLRCFAAVCFMIGILLLYPSGLHSVSAKTYTIKTPEQLRNINWKNEGYGPGHTYIIGNDMTLGDNNEDAFCRLTKGDFVIDFNGHTVQNASPNNTVFKINGANVVLKDSKASNTKPSVRSYGLGAVEITSGKLEIRNGVYYGASNGSNNPVGLHVGGGTCVVNGGSILGDYAGATTGNGTLYVNGGVFQGGYTFALARLGGTVKISQGTFYAGTTTYGYQMALGSYDLQHQGYNFNNMLASGSAFSPAFQTGYWNMQSQMTAAPSYLSVFAVSYNTPVLKVTSGKKAAAATTIKSLKGKSKGFTVKWKQGEAGTSGYQSQYATSKSFKTGKTITVSGRGKTSKVISKLKKKKTYYVRVRTYQSFNGTQLLSKWSKAKKVKTK